MLPFAIDDIDADKVVEMSAVISDALNGTYPSDDTPTKISNAVALAVVATGFIQAVAFALDTDETEMFEVIAEAIDSGALPSFR